MARMFLGTLSVMGLLVTTGCEIGPRQSPDRGIEGRRVDPSLFAAASIDVNPSTRVEIASNGRVELVCQLICLDSWQHTVKAAGVWRLTLRSPRVAQQSTEWELDLTGGEENAKRYDPVTSSYRVRLTGLPAWAAEALVSADGSGEGLILDAVFSTIGADGDVVGLRDSLTVRPIPRLSPEG